jgi:hypothetical protein
LSLSGVYIIKEIYQMCLSVYRQIYHLSVSCLVHNVSAAAFPWRCLPTFVSMKYRRLNYYFTVSRATVPPLKAKACYA